MSTLLLMNFCISLYSQAEILYFSDGRIPGIFRLNVQTQVVDTVTLEGLSQPYSVAYDQKNDFVYWTDTGNREIKRARCDGSEIEVIHNSGSGLIAPRGLIIDTLNSKLLWVDVGQPKLYRSNLDGSSVEILFDNLLDEPHDITLDLINGKMYWTDRAATKIQRADLNGANLETVLSASDGLVWPSGIDLDIDGGKIYWTDTQDDKVLRSNLDGSNIEVLIDTNIETPFRVKFNKHLNKIYWSEWDEIRLYRANSDGTSPEVLLDDTNGYEGIIGLDFTSVNSESCNCIDSEFFFSNTSCADDNYEVIINGVVYNYGNPSGEEVIQNVMGCDSTIYINLIYKETTFEELFLEICPGATVTINNIDYNDPGLYEQTLINSLGCDSILSIEILDITGNQSIVEYSGCENDEFETIINGTVYNEDNPNGEETIMNAFGCDSIVFVNLLFNEITSEELYFEVCSGENISVNGEIYSDAGIFEQILVNSSGCDSILTIQIEEANSTETNIDYLGCIDDGYQITVNGNLYDESNPSGIETIVSQIACDTIVYVNLVFQEASETVLDFSLCSNGEVNVNGEQYFEEGSFTQTLKNELGCDSILVINISQGEEIILIDFDECLATFMNQENQSYDEFAPSQISNLNCGSITASPLYRESQIHSCAPGLNGTRALCIGSAPGCDYEQGNNRTLYFDLSVGPNLGSALKLSCIQFYHKAPLSFDWVDGESGPNNYPQRLSIRILKNGNEVYKETDIPTNNDWVLEELSFDSEEFEINAASDWTVELLPYCIVNNGANVAAWEIENFTITATCHNDNLRIISGNVMSKNGDPLEGVEIINSSNQLDFVEVINSDLNGDFTFNANPMFFDYELSAKKESDVLEGVSTLDLILIQKHILGLKKFTNPYSLIAADVTNNQEISALDLLMLRKVILGIDDAFEDNRNWVFTDTKEEELEINNPWDFQEVIEIPNLSKNENYQNFTGLKIGDVDGSVTFNTNSNQTDHRSKEYVFVKSNIVLRNDGIHSLELISAEKLNLIGLQMYFDIPNVSDLKVVSELFDIQYSDYFYDKEEGVLSISVSTMDAVTVHYGDVLFRIESNDSSLSHLFESINDSLILTRSELYTDDYSLKIPALINGNDLNSEFKLNFSPNPFKDLCHATFELSKPQLIHIEVLNIEGTVVLRKDILGKSGVNKISINSRQIKDNGMYLIRCQTNDFKTVERIIKI